MSELFVSGAVTTWRDYIKADGKLIAVRFNQAGTVTMGYFTLDHLGSVSVITDQNGNIVERDSYDAWGRRRDANGTDAVCGSTASETTRGFTGQEEMDQVCLVNMNARLYDPTIGRFMQADPTVESPDVPQDLNRYSYVGNNPLSLTDPSGLCFLGCFWKDGIFKAIFDIVLAVVLQEFALPFIEGEIGIAVGTAVNAGLAGGIAGYVTTGKLKGALISGLLAFAAAEVFSPQVQTDTTGSNAQGLTNVSGPATTNGGASTASSIQGQDTLGAAKFASPSGPSDFASSGCGGGGIECVVVTGSRTQCGCVGSATVAAGGSKFTLDHPNKSWQSKITASRSGNTVTIKGNLTVSGPHAGYVADAVNANWGDVTDSYDGIDYVSNIHLTEVDANGDLQVVQLTRDEATALQMQMNLCPGLQIAAMSPWGSSVMYLSPWAGNWRNFKIIAHEFGHNLGLTHAPVNSGSIMSYDASRSVIGEDLSHVATGYGGGP